MAKSRSTKSSKRSYERILRDLKVSYTILSRADATPYEFGETTTKDISRSGVCLLLQDKLNVPQLVQLRISIPRYHHNILILAKTVRCDYLEPEKLWEVGMKFVGLLPGDLDTFITKLKRK